MKLWPQVVALTMLAAFVLGVFGPGEAMNRPAVKPTTAQQRFNDATELMCGSENATAVDIAPGVVQCLTTGGRKTKKVTQ